MGNTDAERLSGFSVGSSGHHRLLQHHQLFHCLLLHGGKRLSVRIVGLRPNPGHCGAHGLGGGRLSRNLAQGSEPVAARLCLCPPCIRLLPVSRRAWCSSLGAAWILPVHLGLLGTWLPDWAFLSPLLLGLSGLSVSFEKPHLRHTSV